MPRELLKRYTPCQEELRQHKHLKIFANFLGDPNLFHMNRRSVSGAFAAGLFWAMIPMPLQMVAAAFTAITVRINLPISVALVWISNPITMPPMFYFNYIVGAWVLGDTGEIGDFQLSVEWIANSLDQIWLPLYFGSLIVGVISGVLAYIGIRGYWRWHIVQRYRKRRYRRRK